MQNKQQFGSVLVATTSSQFVPVTLQKGSTMQQKQPVYAVPNGNTFLESGILHKIHEDSVPSRLHGSIHLVSKNQNSSSSIVSHPPLAENRLDSTSATARSHKDDDRLLRSLNLIVIGPHFVSPQVYDEMFFPVIYKKRRTTRYVASSWETRPPVVPEKPIPTIPQKKIAEKHGNPETPDWNSMRLMDFVALANAPSEAPVVSASGKQRIQNIAVSTIVSNGRLSFHASPTLNNGIRMQNNQPLGAVLGGNVSFQVLPASVEGSTMQRNKTFHPVPNGNTSLESGIILRMHEDSVTSRLQECIPSIQKNQNTSNCTIPPQLAENGHGHLIQHICMPMMKQASDT